MTDQAGSAITYRESPNMKIAFQGIEGAYSELAIYKHFGRGVTTVGQDDFEGVFTNVTSGAVDYGLIPIENSIAGTVVENYDLLFFHDVVIVAEIFLPIVHCLLAKSGTPLERIKKVYSHHHALKQCKDFLKKHGLEGIPFYDTAGAAGMISQKNKSDSAAIASELCAEIHNLEILKKGIETNLRNSTRFFVIATSDHVPQDLIFEKTSLAFKTKHYPGALVDCLKIFQWYDLNLTKLESRPIPENPWEYIFYSDFKGSLDTEPTRKAMAELRDRALFVKILGSYPRGKRK